MVRGKNSGRGMAEIIYRFITQITGGEWSPPPERRVYVEYKLIIPGRLPGLNEYIAAERSNRHMGAKMKADSGNIVSVETRRCMRGVRIERPVFMEYTWVEKNRRRDLDNISSFGRKVIQDALVASGVLKDDGWKYVVGFSDRFEVDKDNPRIEVRIREV